MRNMRRPRGHLGPSWGDLAPLERILEAVWSHLGIPFGILKATLGDLKPSGGHLGPPHGGLLGPSCGSWAASEGHLGGHRSQQGRPLINSAPLELQ